MTTMMQKGQQFLQGNLKADIRQLGISGRGLVDGSMDAQMDIHADW